MFLKITQEVWSCQGEISINPAKKEVQNKTGCFLRGLEQHGEGQNGVWDTPKDNPVSTFSLLPCHHTSLEQASPLRPKRRWEKELAERRRHLGKQCPIVPCHPRDCFQRPGALPNHLVGPSLHLEDFQRQQEEIRTRNRVSRVCDLLLFQKKDPKGANPCSKETRMGTSKEGSVSPFPVAKGWGQSYDGIKSLSIFVRSKSRLGGGREGANGFWKALEASRTWATWGLEFEGRGGLADGSLARGREGILPSTVPLLFQRGTATAHLKPLTQQGEAHLVGRKNSISS